MDPDQATSDTPFLSEKELENHCEARSSRKVGWLQRHKTLFFSNIIIIPLCIILGKVYGQYLATSYCAPQSLVYSPAKHSLEYVPARMDIAGHSESKYMGYNLKADEAWTDLTSRSHIRLTEQDLRAINQTSVSLGSGGYLGMLAVYHELHCVKWLRWALEQTRYNTQEVVDLAAHIDHCIDVVRQSIQCRANTAIVTYMWTEGTRVPKTSFEAQAECMNWEKIEAWADEHQVDISKPGELNHPIYGQSYPNGHKVNEVGKPAVLPYIDL